MSHWVISALDAQNKAYFISLVKRSSVAQWLCLDEAGKKIARDILLNPKLPFDEECIFVFSNVTHGGNKDDRRLLAEFLDHKKVIDFHRGYSRDSRKECAVQDLALSSIVLLSGLEPENYGFQKIEIQPFYFPEPATFYVFPNVQKRNQGFAKCVRDFKELGLLIPPKYIPEFDFKRMEESNILMAVPATPDGKVTLELKGRFATLVDSESRKSFGKQLRSNVGEFAVWSFSENGKYLATGSRLYDEGDGKNNLGENRGQVRIWGASTGELVQELGGRLGSITSLEFDKNDPQMVRFVAERFVKGD